LSRWRHVSSNLMRYLEVLSGDEKEELGKLMRALRGLKVAEVELEGMR